jgi:hypothetical protein
MDVGKMGCPLQMKGNAPLPTPTAYFSTACVIFVVAVRGCIGKLGSTLAAVIQYDSEVIPGA